LSLAALVWEKPRNWLVPMIIRDTETLPIIVRGNFCAVSWFIAPSSANR
jgi:hypothetical protein